MIATRKSIRHAIADALTGNTAAGVNVLRSRTRKLPASRLPAILVYTREETAEVFNQAPRELRRVLTVGIEIVARADDDLDDALDDISAQVERIMSENQHPAGIHDILYTGAEITLTAEGDNQHGSCTLTYDATYYTPDVSEGVEGPGVPAENVLTPFERGSMEYKVPPFAEGQPVAKDEISLPQ